MGGEEGRKGEVRVAKDFPIIAGGQKKGKKKKKPEWRVNQRG